MSISEKLEVNLISLFDWGFTEKGGYINVDASGAEASGAYVDNRGILTRVIDPRSTGVFYQGPENWVYESGQASSPLPYTPPLVYVGATLDTTPIINYRDGRITPSIATTTTSVVKAKFSYKWVKFTSARNSPFRRQIQNRQNRTDIANGNISVLPEIRLPLPTVCIDVPPISGSKPYGITTYGARTYKHRVLAYIIGESSSNVLRISDYISSQQGSFFYTFDPTLVVAADDFPLNFDGTPNTLKNHEQLSETYPWATIRIIVAKGLWSGYLTENIYQAVVELDTEIVACLSC